MLHYLHAHVMLTATELLAMFATSSALDVLVGINH